MALDVVIIDDATRKSVRVDKFGHLATAGNALSETFNITLDTDDTPMRLVSGKAQERFIITGFIITGGNTIPAAMDANLDIYLANNDTETTFTDSDLIITITVGQDERTVVTGITLDGGRGKIILAKADDSTVDISLFGYFTLEKPIED